MRKEKRRERMRKREGKVDSLEKRASGFSKSSRRGQKEAEEEEALTIDSLFIQSTHSFDSLSLFSFLSSDSPLPLSLPLFRFSSPSPSTIQLSSLPLRLISPLPFFLFSLNSIHAVTINGLEAETGHQKHKTVLFFFFYPSKNERKERKNWRERERERGMEGKEAKKIEEATKWKEEAK